MKFCENCGSFLRETKEGLWCPKCRTTNPIKRRVEARSVKKRDSAAVYIVDKTKETLATATRLCPKCGNNEAFRWFSRVSGEHAGIRRERTIEHYMCTQCSHSWTEAS